MRRLKRCGQHIIEYVLVISLVIVSLVSLYHFINFLAQGRLEVVSDYVAGEYD